MTGSTVKWWPILTPSFTKWHDHYTKGPFNLLNILFLNFSLNSLGRTLTSLCKNNTLKPPEITKVGIFKGDLFVLEHHERSQLIQQITSFKAVQLDQLGSQNSSHGQHTNVNLTTGLTSALQKLYVKAKKGVGDRERVKASFWWESNLWLLTCYFNSHSYFMLSSLA